jgi:murein DD-endopeptidase MepM/ murein hydrolase activator NlpD
MLTFKRVRMNPWERWWLDWQDFGRFLKQYLTGRLLDFIAGFEAGKDAVVDGLVTKRGRYTRPFLHTGMTGLFLIGLTLTPLLSEAVAGGREPGEVLGTGGALAYDTTTMVSLKPRDGIITYIVEAGDTISGVAKKFDVSIDTIRWQNNLKTIDAIKPGQKIEIPPVTGIVHKVVRGETVYSIAKKYDVDPQQIINWPFNTYANDETFALAAGQTLVVPDGVKPAEVLWDPKRYVAQKTPDAGIVSASGQFIWPVAGSISQRYVWYHRGLDIANKAQPPVLAADSGKVIVAGWPDAGGYGNRVMLDHGNGFVTLYAHLSSISVTVGQTVNRGDVIGYVGSTGRSTGPHLHFEVRRGGELLDPLPFLQ